MTMRAFRNERTSEAGSAGSTEDTSDRLLGL